MVVVQTSEVGGNTSAALCRILKFGVNKGR
jgi:hypothetical protein